MSDRKNGADAAERRKGLDTVGERAHGTQEVEAS